jgi:hypothetical protein
MKLRTPLLALAALGATPAYACSVVPGYRVPSNYELIEKADLVVLARVASGPASEALKESDWSKAQVRLEPIRAIKGVLPAEPLAVSGYVSVDDRPTPRFPTPLHIVHPSALMGACIRQQYAVGALVVAVFKRDGKQLRQEGSPFARSVEDVEGMQGTWVRAADSYARIVALPAKERPAAMEAEARRLLDSSDDTTAPAIAADMFAALEQLPD